MVRAAGINWMALIVAAITIYAIGLIIYGLLVSPEWELAASRITQQEIDALGGSRMPFGVVMPLLTAAFLAVLFKLGNVADVSSGVKWGAVVAFASAIPAVLYGWVYGVGPIELTLLDCGHLLLGHLAAGAILGGWR